MPGSSIGPGPPGCVIGGGTNGGLGGSIGGNNGPSIGSSIGGFIGGTLGGGVGGVGGVTGIATLPIKSKGLKLEYGFITAGMPE